MAGGVLWRARSRTVGVALLITERKALSLRQPCLMRDPLHRPASCITRNAAGHMNIRRGVSLHCRLAETGAWLSAVLTSANLISIFVLQKLGAVLADKEQMKASQGALLRQVPKHCVASQQGRKRSPRCVMSSNYASSPPAGGPVNICTITASGCRASGCTVPQPHWLHSSLTVTSLGRMLTIFHDARDRI